MQPQALPEPVHRVNPHPHSTLHVLHTTQGLGRSWTGLCHRSRTGWVEKSAADRRTPELAVNLTLLQEAVFHAVTAEGCRVNSPGRLHKHWSHTVLYRGTKNKSH